MEKIDKKGVVVMKFKKYYFDVEMIIDHEIEVIARQTVPIATHRMFRGLSLTDVCELIKKNQVPENEKIKITFNIRGENY